MWLRSAELALHEAAFSRKGAKAARRRKALPRFKGFLCAFSPPLRLCVKKECFVQSPAEL